MTEQISVPVEKNGLAKFSLVLGIAALICSILLTMGYLIVWFGWPAAAVIVIVLGLAAFITGFLALRQIKMKNQAGKKEANWGIVLGLLGILIYAYYVLVLGPAMSNAYNEIINSLNP